MLFKIPKQLLKGQQDNPLQDSLFQEELANKSADFLSIRSWRKDLSVSSKTCVHHFQGIVQL